MIVDPYEETSIARAMQNLAKDPELAKDLRRRGQQHVRRFSWKKTVRLTRNVYQELMTPTLAPPPKTHEATV